MSRFQQVKKNFSRRIFGEGEGAAEAGGGDVGASPEEILASEDPEAEKKERGLRRLLAQARKKYIERGLEGNIDIWNCIGMFTHEVSCDVTSETTPEVTDGEDGRSRSSSTASSESEENAAATARAVSAMDGILSMLERRARAWKRSSMREDSTISSGVYVTIPFIGLVSFSITFAVTVKSLLARIERLSAH